MKLCIILSIEDYADEVRKILSSQKVPAYSETSIYGFGQKAGTFLLTTGFPAIIVVRIQISFSLFRIKKWLLKFFRS